MKWEFLGQHCTVKTGKLDANASSENGQYPFFTCAVSPLKIDTYAFDCEAILIAGNGDLNAKHYTGKFNAYQRTYVLSDFSNFLYPRYGYYFLDNYLDTLRGNSVGGVIKYIKLGMLTEAKIPLPPLEEQKRIAAILDKAYSIRQKRQQNLENADALIKSIYNSLCGAGNTNYNSWKSIPLAHVAKSSHTGPFGSALLHSEFVESGISVLGIDNVVKNCFEWDKRRFITPEKYEELKRYTVQPNDVLVSIMGTTGRSAVVPKDIPLSISTKHLATIRVDTEKVSPLYLSASFHMNNDVLQQIKREGKGAVMPGLNLSIIKDLKLKLPPIDLQNKFTKVVTEIETQKAKQQEHLHEADQAFKALQQQFFG